LKSVDVSWVSCVALVFFNINFCDLTFSQIVRFSVMFVRLVLRELI